VEPEDVALFVPRALLYVPNEVLRLAFTPLRVGIGAIERHTVVEHVVDFLYNDARARILGLFRIEP
jgi:hypothetical protein